MVRKESDTEIYYSLAALNLAETAELFDCSERNIRRYVSEQGLIRREDGQFPICTTGFWWLAFHTRKTDPGGDPEVDLTLLTLKLLGVMGFHKSTLKMLPVAECFIRIPMPQRTFDRMKLEWSKGLPRDDDDQASNLIVGMV